MQGKVSQLWTLMNRSQMAKGQLVLLFFISIVEVAAGLAVPLLTMKLINQISASGFAFTSLLPVIGVLIVQAVLSAVAFYMMRIKFLFLKKDAYLDKEHTHNYSKRTLTISSFG